MGADAARLSGADAARSVRADAARFFRRRAEAAPMQTRFFGWSQPTIPRARFSTRVTLPFASGRAERGKPVSQSRVFDARRGQKFH